MFVCVCMCIYLVTCVYLRIVNSLMCKHVQFLHWSFHLCVYCLCVAAGHGGVVDWATVHPSRLSTQVPCPRGMVWGWTWPSKEDLWPTTGTHEYPSRYGHTVWNYSFTLAPQHGAPPVMSSCVSTEIWLLKQEHLKKPVTIVVEFFRYEL